MSMGGSGPEVLTTLTTDMGKILDGIHRTKIKGTSHFSTGINIAAVQTCRSLGHVQSADRTTARSKTSWKQISTATDYRLLMLAD